MWIHILGLPFSGQKLISDILVSDCGFDVEHENHLSGDLGDYFDIHSLLLKQASLFNQFGQKLRDKIITIGGSPWETFEIFNPMNFDPRGDTLLVETYNFVNASISTPDAFIYPTLSLRDYRNKIALEADLMPQIGNLFLNKSDENILMYFDRYKKLIDKIRLDVVEVDMKSGDLSSVVLLGHKERVETLWKKKMFNKGWSND